MLVACNSRGEGDDINAVGMISLDQRDNHYFTIELVLPRQVARPKHKVILQKVPRESVIVLSWVIDIAEIEDRLPDLQLKAISRQRRHLQQLDWRT
ncbi:MAG: hypothetical protein EXS52_00930 [Candidatus Staskawiczbacteria bacterium]|nr:hypothetical protein [Candidatus Staskawiczbacteria bacterium]